MFPRRDLICVIVSSRARFSASVTIWRVRTDAIELFQLHACGLWHEKEDSNPRQDVEASEEGQETGMTKGVR